MTLDAKTEFDDKTDDQTPDGKKADDQTLQAASREEVEALKAAFVESNKELETVKGSAAVIDKLRDVLGAPLEQKLPPRDEYIRKELLRIMPELSEVGNDRQRLAQILPALLTTLEATVEERVSEKAEQAQDRLRDLAKSIGLDGSDNDVVGYLEEVLTREIRGNKELLGLWTRGNVKSAVNKAFEKVQGKLFAPIRTGAKRSAVTTITDGIKPTIRGGPAPVTNANDKPKIDFKDTSRQNVNKIHDGAFDYLQELLERQ